MITSKRSTYFSYIDFLTLLTGTMALAAKLIQIHAERPAHLHGCQEGVTDGELFWRPRRMDF